MNEIFKRHLISASTTFLTVFGLYVLTSFESLTVESFQNGAGLAVLIAAIRAGVKAVLELLLLPKE